jgi:hypothetical protein
MRYEHFQVRLVDKKFFDYITGEENSREDDDPMSIVEHF